MAFGHPKGLIPLFFTEMWERLAFYTMVGILLLYTIDAERGGLGLPRAQGNEIYGLYLAFVIWRGAKMGRFAEAFLKVDLWILNAGLVACVALLFVRYMTSGTFGIAELASSAHRSLLPLSLVATFLVGLRAGDGPVGPRLLTCLATISMAVAVVACFTIHRLLAAAGW